MLIHPNPDPVAFHILSWPVHWYGLMYGLAFIQFLLLGKLRVKQPHIAVKGWNYDQVSDMVFYGMLGVVIGGRLGEVFFYRPEFFFHNPQEIFMLWHGGMSFHGGFLGVVIAMAWWAHKNKKHIGDVYDLIAPLVPLGYAAGRMGNFINHELPGREASADLPWAMQWPDVPYLVHPSPIYQTLVDGVLLFIILWWFSRKTYPRWAAGALYCMLYGCARFFTEYFRTPDWETHFAGFAITSGQVLSLPMIAVGGGVLFWSYKFQKPSEETIASTDKNVSPDPNKAVAPKTKKSAKKK